MLKIDSDKKPEVPPLVRNSGTCILEDVTITQSGGFPVPSLPGKVCFSTGELLTNPGFESFTGTVPTGWTGTNTDQQTTLSNVHTGNSAVTLGDTVTLDSTLSQTVAVQGCCFYWFSFFAKNGAPILNLTAVLEFLDAGSSVIGTGATISINGSSMGDYIYYRKISTMAPPGTVSARVTFTKTGNGNVDIDDASLSIA